MNGGGGGGGGGGGVLQGIIGAWTARKAGKAHGRAVKKAIVWWRQRLAELKAELGPYREYGAFGVNELKSMLETGPGEFEEDPGYQFRLSEGIKARERGAAARGMQLSGAQQKGLERYGQEYATGEYQNFLNRYYQKLQPYQQATQTGLQAAQLGTTGMNIMPQLLMEKGAVQGAYMTQAGQAMGSAASSGLNMAMGSYGGGGGGGNQLSQTVYQPRQGYFGRRMSPY